MGIHKHQSKHCYSYLFTVECNYIWPLSLFTHFQLCSYISHHKIWTLKWFSLLCPLIILCVTFTNQLINLQQHVLQHSKSTVDLSLRKVQQAMFFLFLFFFFDTHIYYVTSFHQALDFRQKILHGGSTCRLPGPQISCQTRNWALTLHAFLDLWLPTQTTGVVSHFGLLLPFVCLQIITELPVRSLRHSEE